MGSKYSFDRNFTDYVHNNLAIDLIYKALNWLPQEINATLMNNVDVNNAVDYFFVDTNNNKIITTQERFREEKYKNYNDFTIRFEREYNPNENRKLSEYYKLNADYFVYGIINSSKYELEKATDFIKYAVIDIKKLKKCLDDGLITVSRTLPSIYCQIIDNKMHCPVNYNKDYSSSFIPVDIKMLNKLFPNSGLIISQKGFN